MSTIEIRTKKKSWAERHPIRSAALYFLLTVGFLIFIGTSGIALVTKLSSLLGSEKSNNSDQNTNAEVLPIPSFDPLPSITNQSVLRVSGSSRAGSMVRIFLNNQPSDTLANSSGKFSMSINLQEGENTVKALTTDTHGNESHETNLVTISLDTTLPEITITSPEDNISVSGKNNKNITISGSINEAGSVKVNDRVAIVNGSGQFSINFQLSNGDNIYTIIATDQANNQTTETRTVNFTE